MEPKSAQTNKLFTLIQQPTWAIEDFIALLRNSAKKRRELMFCHDFANLLAECLSLAAVFRFQDPRQRIINFVGGYRILNQVEAAYFQKILNPVLNEMMTREPNCIHRITSRNFFKAALIRMVQSRLNVEPYFVHFVARLQNEIESKLPTR